jgi:ethanolamine ammonia-lyase small subunit
LPRLLVHSKAADRRQYLQRPDLGRQLNDDAVLILQSNAAHPNALRPDLAIVLADGLSARAVQQEAPQLVTQVIDSLQQLQLQLAPLVIVEQGRVAIADGIGQLLGARMTLMLIGERPGLSSPHSLGAYLTFAPTPGRSDAERNCVSNIRAGGLGTQEAAQRLAFLIRESFRLKLSGVSLKDTYGSAPIKPPL